MWSMIFPSQVLTLLAEESGQDETELPHRSVESVALKMITVRGIFRSKKLCGIDLHQMVDIYFCQAFDPNMKIAKNRFSALVCHMQRQSAKLCEGNDLKFD